VGYVEGGLCAQNQLDSSSRIDTIPACDGRTDGQKDTRRKHSTASHGKKWRKEEQTSKNGYVQRASEKSPGSLRSQSRLASSEFLSTVA